MLTKESVAANDTEQMAPQYTDAVLNKEFCGIQPGTAVKIYAPQEGSEFSTVTTESGQEFKFAQPKNGSGKLLIRTVRGIEFCVDHETLPVIIGKKFVVPAGLDAITDKPADVGREFRAGTTVILSEPVDGKNAITAMTLDGISCTVTREIADLLMG